MACQQRQPSKCCELYAPKPIAKPRRKWSATAPYLHQASANCRSSGNEYGSQSLIHYSNHFCREPKCQNVKGTAPIYHIVDWHQGESTHQSPPITLVSKELWGQLESVLGSHRIVSEALPPHPAGFAVLHRDATLSSRKGRSETPVSLGNPVTTCVSDWHEEWKMLETGCSVPTSMSCILLCETRAKVCCRTGSMRPLLGGAAGSNLQALHGLWSDKWETLCPLCIAINSDELQHPLFVSVYFIWDQGNTPD